MAPRPTKNNKLGQEGVSVYSCVCAEISILKWRPRQRFCEMLYSDWGLRFKIAQIAVLIVIEICKAKDPVLEWSHRIRPSKTFLGDQIFFLRIFRNVMLFMLYAEILSVTNHDWFCMQKRVKNTVSTES